MLVLWLLSARNKWAAFRTLLGIETFRFVFYFFCFYCSDGRVDRASASGAVVLALIPSLVYAITLKLVFTASLLDV